MSLILSFAISLDLLLGPNLGLNTSASRFSWQSGSSTPIFSLHTSCKGWSTMQPFPCFSFSPWTVPSLPVTFPTTCASFHSALFFVSSLSNTNTPVFRISAMLPVGGHCLSLRACTYSFTNLFQRCFLLFCRNLICLVTSSSPIFSRSSSKMGFGFL